MTLGVPSPAEIRDRLEDYGLDLQGTISAVGSWTNGASMITGINTLGLQAYMFCAGNGIAAGTRVLSITTSDPVNGVLVLDTPTTLAGVNTPLSFVYYSVVSDKWLAGIRDNYVMPWVNAHTRQSFDGIKQATEYYDGTGSSLMILRRRPIVSLINIHYTNVDSNLYYLTPSAIQVIADEGILKAKANFNESTYIPIFYKGSRNVVVVYTYGYSTMPDDVKEAICCLCAEQALAHVGSKTGGGDLSGQGYSRSFGSSGKWTHERKTLAKEGLSLLRNYMTMGGA